MAAGFTLVEMAVVIVIIGMLLAALFPALIATRKAAQVSTTEANLQSLMRATAAYVQANGCLPCPALPNPSVPADFGKVGTNTPCGNCNNVDGIPPFASLGIDPSVVKDGWKHWITMHIDTTLAGDTGIVPPMASCTPSDATNNVPGCTSADIRTQQQGPVPQRNIKNGNDKNKFTQGSIGAGSRCFC